VPQKINFFTYYLVFWEKSLADFCLIMSMSVWRGECESVLSASLFNSTLNTFAFNPQFNILHNFRWSDPIGNNRRKMCNYVVFESCDRFVSC